MPSLYAEIEINAPANHVWNALVRKQNWRYWNTFLFDCDETATFATGHEILLAMQRLEGDEETEFQPIVTIMRPDICMKWVSKIPGLRSEHTFELQEITPGRTRYLHRDTFSGILSNVFLPFIRQDEKQGLRRMAYQLKRYVERDGAGYREQDRSYRDDRGYYPPDDQQYYPPDDRRYYPPDDRNYYPPDNRRYYPPDDRRYYPPDDRNYYPPNDRRYPPRRPRNRRPDW